MDFVHLTWVLVFLSVVGNILVIYKKRMSGYLFWLFSNIGWIAYNALIKEYSQMSLFVVYLALAILGIYNECKDCKESSIENVNV